ncbi:MAG TPA: WecB/TagA/CpsF family glycosyltransferase [Candidatus Acidoferrum sp.]|jgi:UDP-N-acetyl-D-mannosaminuronic acid transferase (WecB/TagA/CpsF family)|nr:WecB/TagA/CpsF family glycosyltransferase [Candidatus Acidoferrum sp.]
MASLAPPLPGDRHYRRILGVRFFVGDAPSAVQVGSRAGLMVAPAAPALLALERDRTYREALLEADLAITDSGFLVLLWNLISTDSICRVSGLEYLKLLLAKPELKARGSTLWVMPSVSSRDRNLRWLRDNGYPFKQTDCYIAPKYSRELIEDRNLVKLLHGRRPRHVIICIGGGVQEKLGLYLKRHCSSKPAIHCIGAAIGFLSGDQVRIPDWADQKVLGWLFRCLSDPKRFVPRYARALSLAAMLWRYRSRLPEMTARLN